MNKKILNLSFIKKLLPLDIQIVNLAYSQSNELGQVALKDSIAGLRKMIVADVGNFVNGMNLEYRTYVVGLLSGIQDEYRDDATATVVGFR